MAFSLSALSFINAASTNRLLQLVSIVIFSRGGSFLRLTVLFIQIFLFSVLHILLSSAMLISQPTVLSVNGSNDVKKRTATTEIEYERKTTVFRINLVDVTVRCYYDALFVPNIRNEHFVTCTMFCACLSKYNANARPTNDDGNVFVLNSINITTFSFFVCIFLFHFCLHYLVAWLCSVGLFFLLVLLG